MNSEAKKKTVVMILYRHLGKLDLAALHARGETGQHVDRSEIIAAIIESADLPAVAMKIAKDRANMGVTNEQR